MEGIIVVLIVVILMAGWFGLRSVRRDRIRKRLKARWGEKSSIKKLEDDLVEDVAAYWRKRAEVVAPKNQVDDTTWADLDMNDLFRKMDTCTSVVGSEVFYAMLRETGVSQEKLARREALVQAFQTNEEARTDVQQASLAIGRRYFHGATLYLYRPEFNCPSVIYDLLAIIPIACLIAGIFFPPALLGLMLSFCVNLIVYYMTDATWTQEINAITHIASVLTAAKRLSKGTQSGVLAEEMALLSGRNRRLKSIRRWCPLCGMADLNTGSLSYIAVEYLKIALLLNMVSLRRVSGKLAKHVEDLQDVYAQLGEMDALVSVAAVRASEDVCAPEFHLEHRVVFEGLTHPLLQTPVSNDGVWERNSLITGSNASGKSTFVKALAINLILAQTVQTCFAKKFTLCPSRVMSSMAIRDSVLAGESYFVAEIRSLKRILDAAKEDKMVFAFVDEILRGTNTVERIAASSSVLCHVENENALIMAATHDIELTRILSRYENFHFSERVDDDGVTFDYKLQPGPSRTRNAIALLAQMGFGDEIVSGAREIAACFESEQRWPIR